MSAAICGMYRAGLGGRFLPQRLKGQLGDVKGMPAAAMLDLFAAAESKRARHAATTCVEQSPAHLEFAQQRHLEASCLKIVERVGLIHERVPAPRLPYLA